MTFGLLLTLLKPRCNAPSLPAERGLGGEYACKNWLICVTEKVHDVLHTWYTLLGREIKRVGEFEKRIEFGNERGWVNLKNGWNLEMKEGG